MKRTLLSLTVLILLLASVAGGYVAYQYSMQGKRWHKSFLGKKPTPEAIMAKYYEVTGEGPEVNEQSSMKMKGKITKDPEPVKFTYQTDEQLNTHMLPIEMEATAKFPNKFRLEAKVSFVRKKMDTPDAVRSAQMVKVFDGKKGWMVEITPQGKITTEMDPVKIDELQNDLSIKYMNLLSRYASIRFVGEQKGGGFEQGKQKDFYVLQGVSTRGTLETLFFDVENGFLECTAVETVVGAKDSQRTCFGDYREVNGLKMPFKARLQSAKFSGTMDISSFEMNPPIDDSVFSVQ